MNVDYSRYTSAFSENFNSLSLKTASNPSGTWKTTYTWGDRTLPNNAEQQFYVDPEFKGLGLNPFSIKDGVLTITAKPATDEIKPHIDNLKYTSGLITTEGTYSQTYGYFEMNAKLPEGKGLWPAFWMLPNHRGWPPEIDIMEVLGHDTTTLYTTTHTKTGTPKATGTGTKVPDLSADFHKFAVEWTPLAITFFFDGVEIARQATQADMHTPMYLLANLAVGGHWPGSPDSSTEFPAQMEIDYIRGYTIKDMPTDPRTKWADGSQPKNYIFAKATGAETVNGTSGHDELKGNGMDDILAGGLGNDRYIGGTGKIVEKAGEGIDTVRQFSTSYTLEANVENLVIEYGKVGIGNELNNRIYGNTGSNTIDGGAGDDLLFGQGGRDTFLVKRGQGSDTIGDFRADDKLVLTGSHADFASMMKATTQVGRNVEIRIGSTEKITLADTKLSELSSTQFTYVSPSSVPASPSPSPTPSPSPAPAPQNGVLAKILKVLKLDGQAQSTVAGAETVGFGDVALQADGGQSGDLLWN